MTRWKQWERKQSGMKKNKAESQKRRTALAARWCILAVSVLFLIAGAVKKEYLEVLQKAVRICLECIGIG